MKSRFLAAATLLAVLLPPHRAAAVLPEAAAANEAGARLFRAGALADAIARFEGALAVDPGFEPARLNLGAALAVAGQQALQGGDLGAARDLLERAAALRPDDPAARLLLGALHFRRGDLYEARLNLDRAKELDPGLAEARELSGDLYYQEGWLSQARAEWEAALPAAGARADELRAKIARAGREADAERAFGRDVSRHFTIQYDGPVPAEVARTALRLLEEAHDRLARELGRAPLQDLPVVLYTRGLFDEITRSPAWVAGTYDGKIRVPVGGLRTAADAARLAPILAHELTHAFLRASVSGRLPLWLEEGLAMHFQGTGLEEARRTLRAAGGPFRSLEEVNAALGGGARVRAAYAASLIAAAELLRIDGSWLLRRLLEAAGSGRPFDAVFAEVLGTDLNEFQRRWILAQR